MSLNDGTPIGSSTFLNGECIYFAQLTAPLSIVGHFTATYSACTECEEEHPCPTPTVSPTPSTSITQTPSISITPTNSVTPTPTQTQTPSLTPTPSPSLCADCPDSYTWTPVDSETCQTTLSSGATAPSSPYTVSAQTADIYSEFGTKLYNTINFPLHGSGTTSQYSLLNGNTLWENVDNVTNQGPLNRCAIWTNISSGVNHEPIEKWIGFTDCLTGQFSGETYYVGIGGDNHFRLRLDGNVIVDTRTSGSPYLPGSDKTFKYWNVYPIVIGAGDHNLEIFGWNNGLIAGYGCEIYDNTFTELSNATSLSDINIIYSTSGQTTFDIVQLSGGTYESEGYVCTSDYQYSACLNSCVQTLICSGGTIV